MSITAKFYNLSKRKNSTLLPTGGSEIPIDIKNGCSIENPIIELDYSGRPSFNYFYIPDFERYYFVTGCDFEEGLWIIRGKRDPLASFKSSILATKANILFSSSSSKDIIDSRIPMLSGYNLAVSDSAFPNNIIGPRATILGVTGKGSFGTYVMENPNQIKEILDGVDLYLTDKITNVVDGFKQFFFGGNAAECLKAAFEIPIVIAGANLGSAENLKLGSYPCKDSNGNNIRVYPINNPILTFDGSVSIPWHYNDWRNNKPYTSIFLYIPLIGIIAIDPSEVLQSNSIDLHCSLNLTSGDFSVTYSVEGRHLGTNSTNIALPTPYGSVGIDTNKVMAGGAGIIASAAALGVGIATGGIGTAAALGIAGGMAGGAASIVSSLQGSGSGSAGLGGGSATGQDKVIHCYVLSRNFTDTQSNMNNIMGKPYFGCSTISAHSGYIQTAGFSLKDSNATLGEIEEVNSLMDGGVYIE